MNRRSSVIIVVLVLLAACNVAGIPSTTPAAPTISAVASVPASDAPIDVPSPTDGPSQAPTTEPIPSADLGEFTCDLPLVEQATASGTTNYTEVRIGTHDGYDRVVFEFNLGTPEFTLERDEPPYEQDASGFPLDVEGDSVLHLVLRGGTAMMESGQSSYDGPMNFDPGFPMLVDVVHGGDFEAQTTWFIGLANEACVRVTLLTDPDRLVIDVEQ